MNLFRPILVVSALVAATTLATATPSSASPTSDIAGVRSDEISAARRKAPVYSYQPRPYRGFADPSFGPDGRPYPVPENLRGQCYIDEGYGRFSPCSNHR